MPSRGLAALAVLAALAACWGCGPRPKGEAGNRPPEIISVRLQPDQPSVDAQLTLEIKGRDADGDLLFHKVEWLVNGQVKASGQAQQFSTMGLAPGDQVTARAQASDGTDQSEWVQSQTAVLWPRMAAIDSLALEPTPLVAGLTSIAAVARLSARGSGEETRVVYRWTLDGRALRDSGATAAVEPLRLGQRVAVEAVPVMGALRGRPFRMTATVLGPAPVVGGVEYVNQDSLSYTYRISASDPGGEPLTFSLTESPPGARIDPGEGTVTIPRSEAGNAIRVRVTNRSGSWVERKLETSP